MEIRMAEYGKRLGTRHLGATVRERVLDALQTSSVVTLDFAGAETVAHGFADELLGKLVEDLGLDEAKRRLKITNHNALVQTVLRYVVAVRASRGGAA